MAVAVMQPISSVGPQRRIYSGEATEHALSELIKCDKNRTSPAAQPQLPGRKLEPFVFFEGGDRCFATPKKLFPEKTNTGKGAATDTKAAKSNGRYIAAKRSSAVKSKPEPATAGSTTVALAPAPHCLPPPPLSLLY